MNDKLIFWILALFVLVLTGFGIWPSRRKPAIEPETQPTEKPGPSDEPKPSLNAETPPAPRLPNPPPPTVQPKPEKKPETAPPPEPPPPPKPEPAPPPASLIHVPPVHPVNIVSKPSATRPPTEAAVEKPKEPVEPKPFSELPEWEGVCVSCRVVSIPLGSTDFLCRECAQLPEFSFSDAPKPEAPLSGDSASKIKRVQDKPSRGDDTKPDPAPQHVLEIPVVSSNIGTVLYHKHYQLLQLRFHDGSLYWYFQVPPQTYAALMAAESKGRFGHAHIYQTFVQMRVSDAHVRTFWASSPEKQMETIKPMLPEAPTVPDDNTPVVLPFPDEDETDVEAAEEIEEENEEAAEEAKPTLEELRQNAVEAVSDPVTDEDLVLKDFFGWKEDYFSQADVDFISACLDFDPSKHLDHPSDRLAHCRDLIHGYPSSPVKLEILIWMTRFADEHELFTDANNLLLQADTILKKFLENSEFALQERFDFGITVQTLLLEDIRETQLDPTFETDRLFSMLKTLRNAGEESGSVRKKAKRLLDFCKKVSLERFATPSQDPEINKNKKHLEDLIKQIEAFQA